MAKTTSDREDLLREGTAMPIRGRFRMGDREVVVGWRKDGSCSWFCDLDPVFQFNAGRQLRRVFIDGQRLACEGGRLCRLKRNAVSGDRVVLMRVPLDETEAAHVLDVWSTWRQLVLGWLADSASNARLQVDAVGLSPANFQASLVEWIGQIPETPGLAEASGV